MKDKGLESLENIKGNADLFDEGYQWDKTFSKQFDEDINNIEKDLLLGQACKMFVKLVVEMDDGDLKKQWIETEYEDAVDERIGKYLTKEIYETIREWLKNE